jgi:membrane-associated protease RseP (regulator of RpoE activity)
MRLLERITSVLTTTSSRKYTGAAILLGITAFLSASFGVVTTVVFLLVLASLVAAHEAGHLFVGKALGLPCVEYAVGFGPIVTSRKVRGIQVSVRAIPGGGYVRLADDVDETTISPLKRFLFAAAGPAASVLFGLVLFVGVGITERGFAGAVGFGFSSTVTVLSAIAGGILAAARSFISLFDFSPADTVVTTTPVPVDEPSVGLTGIGTLADLVRAEIELHGMRALYASAASLSILLGLFNALPLPGLDGGHMAGSVSSAITTRTAPIANFLARQRVAKTIDGLRNGAIATVFAASLVAMAWMFLYDPIASRIQ